MIEHVPEPIRPGVLMKDGSTWYPTGLDWLIVFALARHQWAIDALNRIAWNTGVAEGRTDG